MLDPAFVMLCLVILAALLFDYINGFHDTANAIATCVSTRALSVKAAIIMAAVLNFAGAMISTKVATTIGKGIVDAVQYHPDGGAGGCHRGDRLEPDHLVLRPALLLIPCHHRRHHGVGVCPCRSQRPEMGRTQEDHPGAAHFPDPGDPGRLYLHADPLPGLPQPVRQAVSTRTSAACRSHRRP